MTPVCALFLSVTIVYIQYATASCQWPWKKWSLSCSKKSSPLKIQRVRKIPQVIHDISVYMCFHKLFAICLTYDLKGQEYPIIMIQVLIKMFVSIYCDSWAIQAWTSKDDISLAIDTEICFNWYILILFLLSCC